MSMISGAAKNYGSVVCVASPGDLVDYGNVVYVFPINDDSIKNTTQTFKDLVRGQKRADGKTVGEHWHPIGRGSFPRKATFLVGFRWGSKLRAVFKVDRIEVKHSMYTGGRKGVQGVGPFIHHHFDPANPAKSLYHSDFFEDPAVDGARNAAHELRYGDNLPPVEPYHVLALDTLVSGQFTDLRAAYDETVRRWGTEPNGPCC